jgi:hypothetical protein
MEEILLDTGITLGGGIQTALLCGASQFADAHELTEI